MEDEGFERRTLGRWVIAALLGAAALVGAASIVAVFVWAASDVPGWLTALIGVGLAAGCAAFAWVVAEALRRRG